LDEYRSKKVKKMSKTDHLDVQALTERFNDKPDLLRLIYEEFAGQVEKVMPEIRSAFNKGDLKSLESLAHALKGNAALIGAGQLRDLAYTVEKASASGDTEDLEAILAKLFSEVEKTLDELQKFVQGFNS